MNKKVYIILLNYNGWKDTIECLESVLKNDYENYQIIVVDNDSPNNSMEYIINWAKGKQEVIYDENSQLKHLSQPFEPKPLDYVFYTKNEALNGGDKDKESKLTNPIIFIQAGENGGFAAGNNIGIKYAIAKDDFEYVWLLNNDTVIEKDALTNLIVTSDKNKNTLVSSRLLYDKNIIQADGGSINKFLLTTRHIHSYQNIHKSLQYVEPDYLVGASLLIKKEILIDLGLIDEEYFLYYEDIDYSLKAKEKNYNLKVCYDSLVYHRESNSTNKVSKLFITKLYFKNRIKLAKKFNYNVNYIKLGMIVSIFKRLIKLRLKEVNLLLRIIIEN